MFNHTVLCVSLDYSPCAAHYADEMMKLHKMMQYMIFNVLTLRFLKSVLAIGIYRLIIFNTLEHMHALMHTRRITFTSQPLWKYILFAFIKTFGYCNSLQFTHLQYFKNCNVLCSPSIYTVYSEVTYAYLKWSIFRHYLLNIQKETWVLFKINLRSKHALLRYFETPW